MADIDTTPIPEPPSYFQSKSATTYTLNGAFITLIRRHFSSAENIECESLKNYAWSSDDKVSRILIEPVYKWKPEVIQQRPAVIVKRGPWKIQQMGIGSKVHGEPELDGYAEAEQQVLVAGTHTFFCIGTTGLEAEEVGIEVAHCLLCFMELIRTQFCLGRFIVADIAPVSKLDECQDHFGVPVNVEYMLQWNWKLLRQSPIWARVGFDSDHM